MPLRVTVELIPRGDESRKRRVAVVYITNDGTGTNEAGNYVILAEGDTVGGWDTFHHNRVVGVQRGDYLNQAIDCIQVLRTRREPR